MSVPDESRIPVKREMLERMNTYIEAEGKKKGIYNWTELTRRAIDDFLMRHGY